MRTLVRGAEMRPGTFLRRAQFFQKSVLCKILDSLVIVMDATEVNDGNYR